MRKLEVCQTSITAGLIFEEAEGLNVAVHKLQENKGIALRIIKETSCKARIFQSYHRLMIRTAQG